MDSKERGKHTHNPSHRGRNGHGGDKVAQWMGGIDERPNKWM